MFILKKILFSLLLIMLAYGGYAQVEAKIYLVSGDVIEGTIVTYDEGGTALIRQADGTEVKLATSEIEKVTERDVDAPSLQAGRSKKPGKFVPPSKGFYHTLHTGVMAGKGLGGSSVNFTLTHSTGYQFSERWAAGAGMGIEAINQAYFPFYGEARYYPWHKSSGLYGQFRGGYSFTQVLNDDGWRKRESTGGPMMSFTAGIRSMTSKNTAVELSIGYRYQLTRTTTTWLTDPGWWGAPAFPPGTIQETVQHLNRLEIKLGLLLY